MRSKFLRFVGALGLMVVSAAALAIDQPIHVNGDGMTVNQASADALSQAQSRCADLGGTVTHFEVTTTEASGGRYLVYATAICHIP